MTIAAGIDVGTAPVKAVLFRPARTDGVMVEFQFWSTEREGQCPSWHVDQFLCPALRTWLK